MTQAEEHRTNMADQNNTVAWSKAFQFSPDISKVNNNSKLRSLLYGRLYIRLNKKWYCHYEVSDGCLQRWTMGHRMLHNIISYLTLAIL